MSTDDGNGHKHMRIGEMEAIWGGSFKRARAELDVSAFGLSVIDLPPDIHQIPAHSHRFDGQEEVYVPLAGSGWLEIEGERVPIDTGTAVRVGPGARRKPDSGPEGLRLLSIGATPGEAYAPFEPSMAGAPEPNPADLPGVREAAGEAATADATEATTEATADATEATTDATDSTEATTEATETPTGADASFTAKRFDEMEAMGGYFKGVSMTPLRRELGVTSFGMGLITIEGIDDAEYPHHDHADDGQEEVYVPIAGGGELEVEGVGRIEVQPGEMIRVTPQTKRQFHPGPDGLKIIALGGTPGKAYEPRA